MVLFSKEKFNFFSRFFSKLPGVQRTHKHSIHFLNISQLMGVLNDNIFKLVIAFLLIDIRGREHASVIMSTAGAIFVIPFLLFSSTAGVLADRFSKQRLLMAMKVIEMVLMGLAMIAFGVKSIWASYTLLFLLATHSATFGPSKYAIISELVPKDRISKANGYITSFTYLGIIVGTFLASFLTEITHRHFVYVAAFCLFIAIIGFISTFGIQRTPPQGSTKKFNLFFIQDIFATLVFCRSIKHLFLAVCGSAYFLFIGAFTQLNIIPFAITNLGLNEVAGGYLFLSTAFGIALGAYLGGKVSKKRVELGLSCLAGVFIALFFFLIWLFSYHLYAVIACLVGLGISGGLFIVPFDTFVQMTSPNEKRGQVIAANNFLSFAGVLFAAVALYIYSEILGFSPAAGFVTTGFLTLFISIILILRLSDLALPFLSRHLLHPFRRINTVGLDYFEQNPGAILLLKQSNWRKALLLLSVAPSVHLLLRDGSKGRFPWFNRLFYSIHVVHSDNTYQPLLEKAEALASDTVNPCIMLESDNLPELSRFKKTCLIEVDVDTSDQITISFKNA